MNLVGELPAYATRERFNAPLFLTYALAHCSVFIAPFVFTTSGFILFWVLYVATGCLGVTLCYHRLLTHRSYKTRRWVKYLLSVCGVLAFQRGPIWWTAAHRLHHSKVDTPLDISSPQKSFIWSHFLWAFFSHPHFDESPDIVYRLARDIAEDRFMQFLEKYYTVINIGFLLLLFSLGDALGGIRLALSFFVWAGLLRLVFTLHVTWLVNSAAHLWGYRSYETSDTSRNNWWVALLTFGEGWHNNHHADQRAARNGHRWFEFDITYCFILVMEKMKLAWDIVPVRASLRFSPFSHTLIE